ncbi:MAG: phosphoserine transaminase [Gammaproteobacteria bacterium]
MTLPNSNSIATPSPLYNFSGGVGLLPPKVISDAQQAILEVPGTGISALVINHRSQLCRDILDETEKNLRTLLTIPDNYHILFLQGGASLQFSMIPMNLWANKNQPVDYLVSGYWSSKAIKEAEIEKKNVNIIWNGKAQKFVRVPRPDEYQIDPDAAYVHYCSNETVEGLQFENPLETGDIPLVCDMSSDFLAKPIDISKYALIYAHAQKNIGAAGVTVVIIRDDLLECIPDNIPTILDYRPHVEMKSIYNTPPIFAIYVVLLVTRWLLNDIGGLTNMAQQSQHKAALLYKAIDESQGFYRGHAQVDSRSLINVVFNLATPNLERQFIETAERLGIIGLEGHRSLGGVRASLYNSMPVEGALYLQNFMLEFQQQFKSQQQ